MMTPGEKGLPWKRERKASGRKIPEQSGDCGVKEEGE